MKKTRPNPRANKNILWFAYGVVGVFAAMGLYMGVFLQFQSEDVINNPYNARIAGMADRVVRGKLLADDGTVIAETVVGEDGKETRSYPYGELFAHVAGYSTMGKTGLESLVNFHLLSSHVNLMEKIIDELSGEKSTGDNVATTLNLRLQQTAWDALGDRRGAVIAMEPDTGKVLAMVSKPAFDPNTVEAEWDSLVNGDSKEARLLNRATQGLYPPGSTFKVITALEYMREHPGAYDGFHFSCDGIYEYENIRIQCYHKTAHGEEDFAASFANSCNGVFGQLAAELGAETMQRYVTRAGLTSQYKVNGLPTAAGRFDVGSTPSQLGWAGVGQYNDLVNPCAMMVWMGAVANGGKAAVPQLIQKTETPLGTPASFYLKKQTASLVDRDTASRLADMMANNVAQTYGSSRFPNMDLCAKSGTGEVGGGKAPNTWFAGFLRTEDAPYAFVVLVEEGSSGSDTAGAVASKVLDAVVNGY